MASKTTQIAAGRVVEIPVGKLKADESQPRQSIDKASLADLVASIKAQGILQPLTVRKNGAGLVIVMGHRRLEAAKLAGLKRVPCILRAEADDVVGRGMAQVAENSARASLSTMDLAHWLAGLRDRERLTPNDLAARCAKAGLKAMTKAQIDQLISLTKLPDWAQEMVAAGEMEPGAAGGVLEVLGMPAVLKTVHAGIRRHLGYWGKVTAREVTSSIVEALRNISVDLSNVQDYRQDPVLFAWKTRCKGCAHLKQFAGGGYCLDKKLFAEHQAEAKAAGLGPGGKRPQAEKARDPQTGKIVSEEKAEQIKVEQRERSLKEKVQDYLHEYLVKLLASLVDEEGERAPRSRFLLQALILWAALEHPGRQWRCGLPHLAKIREPHEVKTLEDVLAGDGPIAVGARRAAALHIIREMPWRETHALARWRLGKYIDDVWKLDRAFLDLFRKRELIHLAMVHQLTVPEGRKTWLAMKAEDLKLALTEQREKLLRPAILADLYQGEVEKPDPEDGGGEDDREEMVCDDGDGGEDEE